MGKSSEHKLMINLTKVNIMYYKFFYIVEFILKVKFIYHKFMDLKGTLYLRLAILLVLLWDFVSMTACRVLGMCQKTPKPWVNNNGYKL